MSEGLPEKKYEELERQTNLGLELQRQDAEDPERGPIVRQVRAVFAAAYKSYKDKNSPYKDLSLFQNSFVDHFGAAEAHRYRLYHLIIGSTPPGNTDLFDAEGEWSIAEAMQKLAEKYHLESENV